jgi:glutamate synthase domain-containing protein 2
MLFRDHISVPTIPALARARAHLDKKAGRDVTPIITKGLRMLEDYIKAMAMGADGIAVANAAIQAVGCIAARICNTNNCPSGVATQRPELRRRLDVDAGAKRLATFFDAAVKLMQVMARACGHDRLSGFRRSGLTTWKREMADLSGIAFGGRAEAEMP